MNIEDQSAHVRLGDRLTRAKQASPVRQAVVTSPFHQGNPDAILLLLVQNAMSRLGGHKIGQNEKVRESPQGTTERQLIESQEENWCARRDSNSRPVATFEYERVQSAASGAAWVKLNAGNLAGVNSTNEKSPNGERK
jgi:hypothetical protein